MYMNKQSARPMIKIRNIKKYINDKWNLYFLFSVF